MRVKAPAVAADQIPKLLQALEDLCFENSITSGVDILKDTVRAASGENQDEVLWFDPRQTNLKITTSTPSVQNFRFRVMTQREITLGEAEQKYGPLTLVDALETLLAHLKQEGE